ncbi:MAG: TM2 domain-containing protein [Prevotella sp.]|nr:TM2 domain-containing protein [Prevotella sp.]
MENLNDEQLSKTTNESVNANEEQMASNNSKQEGPGLIIEASIANILPSMVKEALSKMSESKQQQFVEEFKRKKKSTGVAYFFLLLCLGMPYGYLGKWGLQFAYWLCLAIFIGFFWMLYLLFALPGLVRDTNRDIATQIVRDLKVMS